MQKTLSLLCAASLAFMSCTHETDNAQYVNLYIGTGGHGHTHPAAVVPHGMVQPGPDTRNHGWDACSGYYYADSTINGFSQTRLSGTGCADLADFLIMPIVGEADIKDNGSNVNNQQTSYASAFSHTNEIAIPGYYSVDLDRYKVKTQITATQRVGFYQFTYPEEGQRGLIVDLDYTNQNQYVLDMNYEVVNDKELKIFHRTDGWAYNQPSYAYLETSEPFTYTVKKDTVRGGGRVYPTCKLVLTFPQAQSNDIFVKVGYSSVDADGAKNNIASELPAWDFEKVRQAAYTSWNEALSKIDIKKLGNAASDSTRRIFYTALYHAEIAPNVFSDADGRYLGMDQKIHKVPTDDPMYTVFSLWDTHRALHPLVSIIEPEKNEAYVRSLIRKGEEGGIVPKWELMGNYTGCMIGYHFASLLADTYMKGGRNFDVEKGLQQAIRSAEYDTTGLTRVMPPRWVPVMMPKARYYKNKDKYIPSDICNESVAKGLEYAYDDWCISQVAKAIGDSANYNLYQERGKYYENYFDKNVGFMRGKNSNGTWRTPFDPCKSNHRMDDYTEGNAWQWTWFVPQDPKGLVELFGSKAKFETKLDSLFTAPTLLTGENVSPDISGLIGQYAHGNEPSHHIIYLYNYIGKAHKTQALADSILYGLYFDGPNGLSGNEDCGQMSAWYILNAAGFYQPCAGLPLYSIARPVFEELTFNLPNNKEFTVKTINNSRINKYIKEVTLNGKVLDTPFFTHEELMNGGEMVIEMTDSPSNWGNKDCFPTY